MQPASEQFRKLAGKRRIAAKKIANKLGAVPVAVTQSNAKLDALLDAGAANVVAADDPACAERLRDSGGEAGFRLAFDAVAGAASRLLLPRCLPPE